MKTPIETLLAVADIGGKLGVAADGRLRTLLPRNCPSEIKHAIRENKAALLQLVNSSFLIVRSATLHGQISFWTTDEANRELLLKCGASPSTTYTFGELDRIVRLNPNEDGLRLLHRIRQTFGGRITNPNL